MKEFKKFEQLLHIQIGKSRYLMISKTIDERISMVQQVKVPDYEGNDQLLFLKNAFIFESIELFEEFRKQLAKIKIEK